MKRKKRCCWCREWFIPHVRLKQRQKTCGSENCKRQQNLLGQRCWKKRERDTYRQNQRDWHKNHPTYWIEYRKKNKEYSKRNRIQSRIRQFFASLCLQKKLDILEVTEISMKYWNLPQFAKSPRSMTPLLWAYELPHEGTLYSGH